MKRLKRLSDYKQINENRNNNYKDIYEVYNRYFYGGTSDVTVSYDLEGEHGMLSFMILKKHNGINHTTLGLQIVGEQTLYLKNRYFDYFEIDERLDYANGRSPRMIIYLKNKMSISITKMQ